MVGQEACPAALLSQGAGARLPGAGRRGRELIGGHTHCPPHPAPEFLARHLVHDLFVESGLDCVRFQPSETANK